MIRRQFLAGLGVLSCAVISARALAAPLPTWSVKRTWQALQADEVRLVDIRSREEWQESGVADRAWPISLHEADFSKKLFLASQLAEGRPLALICATGGRTAYVSSALSKAGYDQFIDVGEGIFGSPLGRGWIAEKLPMVSLSSALAGLPPALRK